MRFPERLKELRNRAGLSQEELGNRVNLTKANISKYENGRIEPNIETITLLSSCFGVSTDFLLGNTDDPTPYRDINADIDAERDFDAELKELLKDEDLVAFHDFAKMDNASKKEIIQFIKFKKSQKEE